jgi:hypothetical protein
MGGRDSCFALQAFCRARSLRPHLNGVPGEPGGVGVCRASCGGHCQVAVWCRDRPAGPQGLLRVCWLGGFAVWRYRGSAASVTVSWLLLQALWLWRQAVAAHVG